MKKAIQPSIIFSYYDLIIAHYISLVLVWGIFVTDIEEAEKQIDKSIIDWINTYDFKAINTYYKRELNRSLSFEELLRMIIDFQSLAYVKMNYRQIKEAYYPIGWQRDSEPSGFDLYCDEVFQKVVDED
jgi:hypothetical protein